MKLVIDAAKLAHDTETVVVAFVKINDKHSGTLLFSSIDEASEFIGLLRLAIEESLPEHDLVVFHS